jgi:hypothetical protein
MGMRLPIVIAICTFAFAACEGPDTQLDAHELRQAAHDLTSLSAEAGLLAEELSAHDVTSQFASVHQQGLGEESLKLSKQLAKPVPAGLRTAHDSLAALNARLQTDLARIAQASAQPDELRRLRETFLALSAQAKALEGPA